MKRIFNNMLVNKMFLVLIIIVLLFEYFLPIKIYASTSVAEDLQNFLQNNDFGTPTISVTKCQEIINEIEKADSRNKVTSGKDENGDIVIYINVTEKYIVKNAFNKVVKENMGDYIEANFYDYFVVNVNPIKDETDNKTNENNSVAQALQTILNDNASTLGKYNTTLSQCEKIISRIENSDSRNKVTVSNGVIKIASISTKTVEDAFQYAGGYEQSIAELIASNNYSFFTVDIIDANSIPDGKEDTRTDEQKIIDAIVSKYPSISPESARIIVENDKYEVTKDEEGNITDIKLNLTQDEMNAYGISDKAQGEVYKEQKEDSVDIGGILLSPVFALVNFVADAVVSGIGSVMIGKGSGVLGTGVLSDTKPTELNYENTDTHEIDMSSFKNLKKIQYPHITYTPEEIFSGNVDILSIDFISGKVYDKDTNALRDNKNDGWKNIRKVISQWYQILRMIAIIGFLSVLIYTGIKIIISSNAKDKAKYKEWIINWLIGVTILFFMHYIMAFTVSFNREFSNLVSKASNGIHVVPISNEGSSFDTNLMGLVRFMIQSQNFFIKIAYETMYIALIVYTIKFTVTYIRRVLYMAFLTLIAPIVALTYPIDKMNDGSAQGFNMWLKEYVFNALLQPMHCILYYVLVGSAIDVAANNPIYGIVVLAFMSQAEKIFKKIFGFDKANPGTVGGMTDAFAAGAIAANIAKMAKFSKSALKGGNAGGNAQNNLLDNVKPLESGSIEDNFKDNLLDGGNSSNGNTMGGTSTGGSSSNGSTTGRTSTSGNSSNGNSTSRNNSTNRNSSTDSKEPATGKGPSVKNGLKNVGKKLVNPVYAIGRGKEYNKKRWLRRLGKGAKGVGKLAIGTAAAAVQAGISITDGKYTLKEGIASFAAGYAGGGKLASGIGRAASSVSGSFKEGYYEGDQGALREKQKQQFMDNDEIYKMYKNKYGSKAETMQRLAADNMVPYGYTDVKEQFKIQKMANEIIKKNDQYKNYDNTQKQEYMEKALKQARNTKAFIDSPGVSGIVHSPGKQEDYIKAEIKSRGITDEKSQEAQAIRTGLQNAFNSAAVWQQVNK